MGMKGSIMEFIGNPIVFFIVGIMIVIIFFVIYLSANPDVFMGFFEGFAPK